MLMQIFAALFISGFIACAVIGHVALFHAIFARPAQPVPQPAEWKPQLVVRREAGNMHEHPVPTRERVTSRSVDPALRIA